MMKRFYVLFAGLCAACLILPLLVAWPSRARPAAADGRAVLLTATPSATPQSCDVQFEDTLFQGDTAVDIIGEAGTIVTVTDLTTGTSLSSGELLPATGHLCSGYAELNLEFALVLNHVILVESDDGSFDVKLVQAAPGSVTITPTPINSPWIVLSDCVDQTETSTLTVNSYGWFPNSEVGFYWDDVLQTTVEANPNGTASAVFAVDLITGTHQLSGLSISQTISLDVVLPCKYIVTPEPPTMTPYATPTPAPVDLEIGSPLLISTPPINAYSPVSFTVAISNTSAWDVSDLFFVDLFFDPPHETVTDTGIDLAYSNAYQAIGSLAAGTTKFITITADIGFEGMAPTHTVYAMVDSVKQISETDETNNVSGPLVVDVVYITPTPSPTPGNSIIAGSVFSNVDGPWQPQGRAAVYLYQQDGEAAILTAITSSQLESGYYSFASLSENTDYLVVACFNIGEQVLVGSRTTAAPNQFLDVFIVPVSTGCPNESGPQPTPQPTPSSTPEQLVSGRVANTDAQPLDDISVTAYQWDGEWWRWAAATTTNSDGRYAFGQIDAGLYRFNFYDPAGLYQEEYYNDEKTLETAADVYVNGFVEVKIDAILQPLTPTVTIGTGTGSSYIDPQTGTVVILQPWGQRGDIVVEAAVNCADDLQPTNVVLETNTESYPMVETEVGLYEATIPAADVSNGLTISIAYECDGESKTQVVGTVQLYDPSGVITHALTGEPLQGATVTLYNVPGWTARTDPADDNLPNSCESNNSKPAGQPWSQPAPVELGVLLTSNSGLMDPAVNRQTTSTDGRYGWDVAAGCWFVIVERPGYETLVSPVVGVPPAVTDLDLALRPQYHLFLPLFVHP